MEKLPCTSVQQERLPTSLEQLNGGGGAMRRVHSYKTLKQMQLKRLPGVTVRFLIQDGLLPSDAIPNIYVMP
jgi:hypothetical protein